MRRRLRRHAGTILVAAVTAMLTTGGPAVLAGITNADSVDGFSARSYTGTPGRRANLLIAANAQGYLPNNIVRKAPDANRLDGIDSTGFLPKSGKAADADELDGLDSAAFAPASALEWRPVRAAAVAFGERPGYFWCETSGALCAVYWENLGGPWSRAAFASDPFGVVHLKGVVRCVKVNVPGGDCVAAPAQVILLLPEGYRPSENAVLSVIVNDQVGRVTVDPEGRVIYWAGNGDAKDYLSLDGITFPAAP